METIISPGKERQAIEVAQRVAQFVAGEPQALLCLAAGDTPTLAYGEMARLQREGQADFSRCRLVGLDEWAGIDGDTPGGCKYYIYRHVVGPLGIREKNIFFFDACAADLQRECALANEYLAAQGPIGLSLMGVGRNGHIALNEPGCPFALDAHTPALDGVTKQALQRYFGRPVPITRGITLGMRQILASRLLLVMASGAEKREIMAKAMRGSVTTDVPASALQTHPNCLVSLDEAAAGC